MFTYLKPFDVFALREMKQYSVYSAAIGTETSCRINEDWATLKCDIYKSSDFAVGNLLNNLQRDEKRECTIVVLLIFLADTPVNVHQ